jgi:hypothetical protein
MPDIVCRSDGGSQLPVRRVEHCLSIVAPLAIVLFVTALAAISPPSAHAGLYNVWACADRNGRSLGTGDWHSELIGGSLMRTESKCLTPPVGQGGFMFASADPAVSNGSTMTAAGWTVAAATGTTIKSLDLWWFNCAPPLGSAVPGRIQVYAGTESLYARDSDCFGPGGGVSPQGRQSFTGLTAQSVAVRAWCLSRCNDGNALTPAYFDIYRVKAVVEDPSAPTGSATGLIDGMRVAEPVAVQAQAGDPGSGVRALTLRVDDAVVQHVSQEDRCSHVDSVSDQTDYNNMRPCPTDHWAALTLSPTALADGARHVVSILATNAAGEDAVIETARVALAAPAGFFSALGGFLNPDLDVISPRKLNGATGGLGRAHVAFAVRRGKRVRFIAKRAIASRSHQRIVGRLLDVQGVPITGARVWVAVAVTDGVWQLSGEPMITSETGSVTGVLPAHAPSRDIRLVYFPYSDSSENVQSPPRHLKVRASTTIETGQAEYRNGETADFWGRVTTGPVIRRKVVYLQVVVRGKWRTFDTTRADSKGRWGLRYRFTATRRPTVYRFRAVVPTEHGFPWATGHSRAVGVLVTP